MRGAAGSSRRRFLASEVIQTSAMDCGPASLKCLLDGHGLPASYGRLREACQTDVDGTSIDVLEDVAVELGLDAEQIMVPRDHLLLDVASPLPALVVVQRPHAPIHFVVVWRVLGPWVQIMDPGSGRRWTSREGFLREVLVHETQVPLGAWFDWACSEAFLSPLARRLAALGLSAGATRRLVDAARGARSWMALASLDAAARMFDVLARRGAAPGRSDLERMLEALSLGGQAAAVVPDSFWSVSPRLAPPDDSGEQRVTVRGAVLLSVKGRREGALPGERQARLSPDLAAAVRAPSPSAWAQAFALLRADGLLDPWLVGIATLLAAVTVVLESVLLRGLLDLSISLGVGVQRFGALLAAVVFVAARVLLTFPVTSALMRAGRKLELRLRLAFLEKLPRIGERYFHSRLVSDMAERSHALPAIRRLPQVFSSLWSAGLNLAFTFVGLVSLEPSCAPAALAVIAVSAAMALLTQVVLSERDLRARSHGGTLVRYLLDALQGLTCIRAHGAEKALQREHEAMLVHWTDAHRRLQAGALAIDALQSLVSIALSAWLVIGHVSRAADAGSVLLFAYWALLLPALGGSVALAARQVPGMRNVLLRLMEPLSAPEDEVVPEDLLLETPAPPVSQEDRAADVASVRPRGVRIEMRGVSVVASGNALVESIDLDIEPSSHVAIVGLSGAGKSTLVSLLLGWHRPASGEVLVDGELLDAERLARLRRDTAWVDPAVRLFGKALLDNLTFGASSGALPADVAGLIDDADLRDVVERLPEGLQTPLGEGGALVSGGEGQRVRLGRAMLRRDARLVILDEPFRGLDRERRRRLLVRAREYWQNATLLCITHDVGETRTFPRALVVENGRIVEDGDPNYLGVSPSSRYAELLAAEEQVRHGLWSGVAWRRLRMDHGRLVDASKIRAMASVGEPHAPRPARELVR